MSRRNTLDSAALAPASLRTAAAARSRVAPRGPKIPACEQADALWFGEAGMYHDLLFQAAPCIFSTQNLFQSLLSRAIRWKRVLPFFKLGVLV